jgi:hypothetical protein
LFHGPNNAAAQRFELTDLRNTRAVSLHPRTAPFAPLRDVFQGLRRREAEIVRRQVTVSKTFDRHSEETLGFSIQVEKPIFKEASQLYPYSGLADTANASEEYAHVRLQLCRWRSIIGDS